MNTLNFRMVRDFGSDDDDEFTEVIYTLKDKENLYKQ